MTAASGLYKVLIQELERAPPLMIIHSERKDKITKKPANESRKFYLISMYSEGLGEPVSIMKDKNSKKGNPYGFT